MLVTGRRSSPEMLFEPVENPSLAQRLREWRAVSAGALASGEGHYLLGSGDALVELSGLPRRQLVALASALERMRG